MFNNKLPPVMVSSRIERMVLSVLNPPGEGELQRASSQLSNVEENNITADEQSLRSSENKKDEETNSKYEESLDNLNPKDLSLDEISKNVHPELSQHEFTDHIITDSVESEYNFNENVDAKNIEETNNSNEVTNTKEENLENIVPGETRRETNQIEKRRRQKEWSVNLEECENTLRMRLRKVNPEENQDNRKQDESDFSEDCDDSVADPNYSSHSSISSSDLPSDVQKEDADDENDVTEPVQKTIKSRAADPREWKKNKATILINSGKAYISSSNSKKQLQARQIRPPCGQKCRLQCITKINEAQRLTIFAKYWGLENLARQRDFLSKSMTQVEPSYRYQKPGSTRRLNHSFYFEVNEKKHQVCKQFFKATLDINDRPIRTVIEKNELGFITEDFRGKHGQHKKLDVSVKDDVRRHINSIPRIESHYLRQQTSREFIDGGKTIADLYRDYKSNCIQQDETFASLSTYTYIFNHEFNISFFVPKKDQCELCVAFENASNEDKESMKGKFEKHLKEKRLSREEKERDKEKYSENYIVACYDLQAVLPVPKGNVSVFYYKSKLNSYNFTISELKSDEVFCYFWHECEGNRGAIEINSCVYKYLEQLTVRTKNDDPEVVFYSDNCCGQQKNKFTIGMYLHAVSTLRIKSITHKFLIAGHTQNEGDNVHSVIEKAVNKTLKSGPIYEPYQYVSIIRAAKKTGKPYKVLELTYDDFVDFKGLCQEYGNNFSTTENNEQIKIGDIKMLIFDEFKLGRYESNALDGCPDGYMQLSELGRPFTGGSWCGSSSGPAAYYSETSTVTVSVKLFASPQLPFVFRLRYRFVSRKEAVVRFGSPSSPLERGQVAPGTYCTRQFEECYRKPCRLQSPNYPGMYPRNVSCYWSLKQKFVPTCKHAMIAVRQEAAHKMHMKRSINVAGLNKTARALRAWRDCTGERDHLIFYDGGSTDDPVLAKYCGGDWLPRVVSRGPEMLVAFHSSPYSIPLHSPPSQSPLKGFELDVDIIFADSDSLDFARHRHNCDFEINATSPESDEIWTGRGRKGRLISPKHSLPPNTTCTYRFRGFPGDIVWISFTSYIQRPLLIGESGHALLGNSSFGGGCLTRLRIWDNRTLIEDKCDEPPLLCDHSALSNSTRATRPCTSDESYISVDKNLILQHHTEDGTALHPASFKVKYEFVDTRMGGDPWPEKRRTGPCHRVFKRHHVGEITGPRNVFLFGRGGSKDIHCIYRFEAGGNERVQLTINNASFGVNPSCETLTDPHSGRQICEYYGGGNIAEFSVYEVPWPDIQMPKGCVCDNSTLSSKPLVFISSSRTLELHFKAKDMKITEDYTVLHFHALFELVKLSDCPRYQRLRGDGGEVQFSYPPADKTETLCLGLPWLVEARHNKSLFLLSWGAFLPLKPRPDEPSRCPTVNRILVYSGKPPKLIRAICPAEPGARPLAVHVFSEEWRGEGLAHMVQRPPRFVIEWIGMESAIAAFNWLEISRSKHSLLTQLQVTVNVSANDTELECAHKCPELDACISSSLWCDGKDNCPSGYDEAEAQCGATTKLLNSLPLAALAAGFAVFASVFLLICLTVHRLRARRRRKLAKKKLNMGPRLLDPGLDS